MGLIWFFINLFFNTLHLLKFFLLCFFYLFVFMIALSFLPISLPYVIYRHKKMRSIYSENKMKYKEFINTIVIGEKRSKVLRQIRKFNRKEKCHLTKQLFYSFGTVELPDRFIGNNCIIYKLQLKFKRGKLDSYKHAEYNRVTTTTYY